jgi:hypothetical protein
MMRAFLTAVLSVIAVGVMLIAYGLLNPRAAVADGYPSARPMLASERVGLIEDGYAPNSAYAPNPAYAYTTSRRPMASPVSDVRAVPASSTYGTPAPRGVTTNGTTTNAPSRVVERAPGRDWTKTAMVIGGTTAAGAGLGAIFGGKKGALIGAAIGGGAGTIYEVRNR